jgi:hypothetical protein
MDFPTIDLTDKEMSVTWARLDRRTVRRGCVSRHFLGGYVAIHEFAVNLKRVSADFISSLVHAHLLYP